jgi:KDO2-lipid IV(A) lauroyltransferase
MSRRKPRPSPYSPRVWPAWAAIALGWLVTALPVAWLPTLGAASGRGAFYVAAARRRIARTNIALCFPELSPEAQGRLTRESFEALGIGLVEILLAWLHPRRIPVARLQVVGREHLDAALAEGRGVVLLGAHFAVMDLIAPVLAAQGPIDLIYRENKNPAWEWLQVSGRRRFFERVIERDDTRGILRSLRDGRAIWYAPDQDYGPKHSVFAPFFGVPAATITATMRLARLRHSPVLLLSQHRTADRRGAILRFSPVLEDFPSGNDGDDAARINALLEAEIRRAPAQYLWIHRRFKSRPPGEPALYARKG